MAFAPAIGAIVSLVGTVASTVVGVMGAQQQAKAQAQAAQYQAQVARNNSIMMQQSAAYERQKGAVEAQNQDMKNRATMGAIEAGQAASGFDLNNSKSLVDTRTSAAQLGRLDTLTTANNAERKARDFDIAAVNQTAQAGMYDMTASNAKAAGNLQSFATIIGGVSSFGSKFADFSKAGMFG